MLYMSIYGLIVLLYIRAPLPRLPSPPHPGDWLGLQTVLCDTAAAAPPGGAGETLYGASRR